MSHRNPLHTRPIATPTAHGRGLLAWVGPAPESAQAQVIAAAQLQLQCVPDRRAALVSALPWVAVVHAELPDGDGIELVAELHRRQPQLRSFLVASQTNFDLCRRAFRAGAEDVWPAPVDTRVVAAALAQDVGRAPAVWSQAPYVDRLRALGARLLEAGACARERARVVSAVAQALDGQSPTTLDMVRTDDRVRVELHCTGGGEELETLRAALLGDPNQNGLARAQLLTEELRIERSATGICIALDFRTGLEDPTEPEWLDSEAAQAALVAMRTGRPPFPAESPLAAVLGTWLGPRAAREAERRAQRSLWS
ncbi:MAG: hypothetical protein GC161_18185 [Planctomycetaceae bacterium]|nr:hypothetical protein [Planctomycetaceae bacterium]